MITLKQALIIVLAVLIVFLIVQLLINEQTKQKNKGEELPHIVHKSQRCVPDTSNNFMIALNNNTTEQRPGSKYYIDIPSEHNVPPAYTIKLLYKPGCVNHQLVMLFEYAAKQMLADGTAAAANVGFERELIDPLMPCNLYGGFPKVIKIRRSGQVLEYTGCTDYGPFVDWIMNEQILF